MVCGLWSEKNMGAYPEILEQLITELSFLPGIGRRSAERLALYLLEAPVERIKILAEILSSIREKVKPCKICNNFSAEDICSVCANSKRNRSIVCIVEYPKDLMALEKAGVYKGVYYVLLGSIAPLEGRSHDSINIQPLINRLEKGDIDEIIIATDSDSEGETTAVFLKESFSRFNVKVSRIGIGLPIGSQIEFTDSATLGKALEDRRPL